MTDTNKENANAFGIDLQNTLFILQRFLINQNDEKIV